VRLYTRKDGVILHEPGHDDYSSRLIQTGVLRSKPNF